MLQTAAPDTAAASACELQFRITGMTCAGSAAAVQRAIEADPAVSSAAVSVTDGLATVKGAGLQPDSLIQAIEGRGFEAEELLELPAPAELRSEIELRQARSERQWRFRAIVGLSIWVPMAILHWAVEASWVPWAMLVGATIVLGIAGAGFYRSAWRAALKRTTNMDTLIALGVTVSFATGILAIFG